MNVLFFLLFLGLIITLPLGLMKPSIFSGLLKGEVTRKRVGKIFGVAILTSFLLFVIATGLSESEGNKDAIQSIKIEDKAVQAVAETENNEAKNTPVLVEPEKKIVPIATPAQPPVAVPASQIDRSQILAILKARASEKWGDDYEMVKFQYDNQVKAYDWVMAQDKYPEIMIAAKNKWGHDYEMVKFNYENQVKAYEWIIKQTAYPEIMLKAKQKWKTDYEMVKFEYENQVEAYESL